EIENVNDEWTEYDITRVYKELSKLVSPNHFNSKYPFKITIKSQYPKYGDISVQPLSAIDYATVSIEVGYDKKKNTQETVVFEKGELIKKLISKPIFGFVKFSLYYFDQSAKRSF